MSHPIDDANIAWLKEYEASTLSHFQPRFAACEARFAHGGQLLARYSTAVREVIAKGRSHFSTVDEAHNEICVADAIVSDPSTTEAILLYEPPLPNTDKTIDFAIQEISGRLHSST